MCQALYFNEFRQAVSSSWLKPYFNNNPNGDDAQVFAAYLWNVALCESLYPSLHGIEVALRNSIHQAASTKFSDEFWFKKQLTGYEKGTIEKLDEAFSKIGGFSDPGRYISECTFGF